MWRKIQQIAKLSWVSALMFLDQEYEGLTGNIRQWIPFWLIKDSKSILSVTSSGGLPDFVNALLFQLFERDDVNYTMVCSQNQETEETFAKHGLKVNFLDMIPNHHDFEVVMVTDKKKVVNYSY
jgi:hypothetical protein